MRHVLLFLLILLSFTLKGQYYISRNQINFIVDGELLLKKHADCIHVLIKKNNEVYLLKDTLYFGYDGDAEISFYFIIEGRVISFNRKMFVNYFFDILDVEYAYPREYEFIYTHIEMLIPISKENTSDYKEYPRKHRKWYYGEPPQDKSIYLNSSWVIVPIKILGRKIPKENIFYGVARFKHNRTSLTSPYKTFDYK